MIQDPDSRSGGTASNPVVGKMPLLYSHSSTSREYKNGIQEAIIQRVDFKEFKELVLQSM